MISRYISCCAFLGLVLADITEGRGQDQLTPDVSEESSPQAENNEEADAPPTEASNAARSEFSKSLEKKLSIGSGVGYTSLSGADGWTAGMTGDFRIGYIVSSNFLANGSASITYRYLPLDVTVQTDNQSYQGVIESHYFGGTWTKQTEGVEIIASGEVGLVDISLSSTDGQTENESLEDGTFSVALGGGANWTILDKVKAGPRAYIGFGAKSYFQLGGTISFLF